jgi:hypothetical protein
MPPEISITDSEASWEMISLISSGRCSEPTASTSRSSLASKDFKSGTQRIPSNSESSGTDDAQIVPGRKPLARIFLQNDATEVVPALWKRRQSRFVGDEADSGFCDKGGSTIERLGGEKRHRPSSGTIKYSVKAKGLISSSSMTYGACGLVGE